VARLQDEISVILLYDFIDQEINIMHVTVLGKHKSTKLDLSKRRQHLPFKGFFTFQALPLIT